VGDEAIGLPHTVQFARRYGLHVEHLACRALVGVYVTPQEIHER
jgi:hypothetical protein